MVRKTGRKMKRLIITMRNKETGMRWVFCEEIRDERRLHDYAIAIMKKSPELVLVKMTIKR